MEDKITIIEGPTPEFEDISDGWALGLNESPLLYDTNFTQVRTLNGPALVERCHRAWKENDTIYLHFKNKMGIEEKAPITAVRSVDTDEGQILLLWVRQLPSYSDLVQIADEMGDFDDDIDDDDIDDDDIDDDLDDDFDDDLEDDLDDDLEDDLDDEIEDDLEEDEETEFEEDLEDPFEEELEIEFDEEDAFEDDYFDDDDELDDDDDDLEDDDLDDEDLDEEDLI